MNPIKIDITPTGDMKVSGDLENAEILITKEGVSLEQLQEAFDHGHYSAQAGVGIDDAWRELVFRIEDYRD